MLLELPTAQVSPRNPPGFPPESFQYTELPLSSANPD